jgi:hypothetical protein
MRKAASCGHPLQEMAAPRGALMWRLRVVIRLERLFARDVAAVMRGRLAI